MFANLPVRYPRVRGLVCFDAVDRGIDWPIETSLSATSAFATGIRKADLRRQPLRRTRDKSDPAAALIRRSAVRTPIQRPVDRPEPKRSASRAV